MKKIILKYIFVFLILNTFYLIINSKTFAADLNVNCGDSGCAKSGLEPLYNTVSDGYWYPGRLIQKTIALTNSSGSTKEIDIGSTRTSSISIIEDKLIITFVTSPGGLVIWSGGLTDFYNQTRINMGAFSPSTSQDYLVTVSMTTDADNNYQNLQTSFDLTLGFWEESPTPTPIPSGSSDGGGGGVAAPVCNDTKPASAPGSLSAIADVNSVRLTWSQASDPVSYYLVAYGVSPNDSQYGNPNIGGKGTTGYIVTNLSGGITYCFKVRAGNGCMPGEFSNTACATPSGGSYGAVAAPGFAPGVLGVSTPSAELSVSPPLSMMLTPGETKGAKTARFIKWYLLFSLALGAPSVYFLYKILFRRKFPKEES